MEATTEIRIIRKQPMPPPRGCTSHRPTRTRSLGLHHAGVSVLLLHMQLEFLSRGKGLFAKIASVGVATALSLASWSLL